MVGRAVMILASRCVQQAVVMGKPLVICADARSVGHVVDSMGCALRFRPVLDADDGFIDKYRGLFRGY